MGKHVLTQLEDDDLIERLGISNDMELDDFDLDAYREPFWAYMPDRLDDLASLDEKTLLACAQAESELQQACEKIATSAKRSALVERLLREEAASSARIEGIDASAESLAKLEQLQQAGMASRDDSAAQAALDIASMLRDWAWSQRENVSVDDLCDMNAHVTETSEVSDRCGCLRETQVWIGSVGDSISDAAYVPPPAEYLDEYMQDLVRYVNRGIRSDMSPVALAALAHAQLVLIHPFEDGNGRTARILSQIVLCWSGLTRNIAVPLCTVLLEHRVEYIDMLTTMQEARDTKADPNEFVRFFCRTAMEVAGRMSRESA